MIRICEHCKGAFLAQGSRNWHYCSPACNEAAHTQTCSACGGKFRAAMPGARSYCSPACTPKESVPGKIGYSGTEERKAAGKRTAAKRYRNGRLPPWMFS